MMTDHERIAALERQMGRLWLANALLMFGLGIMAALYVVWVVG